MKLNGQILLLYNFYYYTLSCFSKLCMWLFSHYVCTQIITAWVAPFLGTRNFFAVWLQTSFPWFFPLASIFISSRVKTWKNVCYFTIKFRLLLSGCRILFFLLSCKKVYETCSSNPILWHWFKGVIYLLDAWKCCGLNTWFSKWIKVSHKSKLNWDDFIGWCLRNTICS